MNHFTGLLQVLPLRFPEKLTCFTPFNGCFYVYFASVLKLQTKNIRNSHQGCSIKKRCSQKFHRIHRKAPVPRPATLLQKRLWCRCFPVNFEKFLRTPFSQNTSGRLLLKHTQSVPKYHRMKINTEAVTWRCSIKSVFKNFAKFTGKHLCQSLFSLQRLWSATLLKKRLWNRCFPVNFSKFLRTVLFIEHLRWLFLQLL